MPSSMWASLIRRPSAASTSGSALARNRYGLSAVVLAVAYPRPPLLAVVAVNREGPQRVLLLARVGGGRSGRAGRAGRGRAGRVAPRNRSERIPLALSGPSPPPGVHTRQDPG